MEQVLTRYRLKDQFTDDGRRLIGPCPIRQSSPSAAMQILVGKNSWSCSSECCCQGNVLDFVARMEKVEPLQAARLLVEWFKVPGAAIFPKTRTTGH